MADETVKPNRMELMNTKAKTKLAQKGHKLLKQKRDVLIMEFIQILSKAQDVRKELNVRMAEAYASLGEAEAHDGIFKVENAALAVSKAGNVGVTVKSIMGVQVPNVEGKYAAKNAFERGYSVSGTSAKIDESASAFEKCLATTIELARTENALLRLLKEIEKTKRRVNALEYLVMPRLKKQSRYISMRLDEMERETFFTLKTIKKKMDRKES